MTNYSEQPLHGRTKLAYEWLPEATGNLLDAGCAWGYATSHFASKSRCTLGIDIDSESIRVARLRYPDIEFFESPLEETPFKADLFDVVVMNDVLEHVGDELGTLNEMFRILRPGGIVILTVPHRGLFSFLDKANYGYYVRKHLPGLYEPLLWLRMAGKGQIGIGGAGECVKHRHYSLEGLVGLLRETHFSGRFEIVKVFRSGLFAGALISNLEFLITFLLGKRRGGVLMKPFHVLAGVDFCIPFGIFSYNIAVKLIKK